MTKRERRYHAIRLFKRKLKGLRFAPVLKGEWEVAKVQLADFEQQESELFTKQLCETFKVPYELYEGKTTRLPELNVTWFEESGPIDPTAFAKLRIEMRLNRNLL